MTYYYTDQNKQPQGPVSIEDLRTMLDTGVLNSTTLVALVGSQQWQPINDVVSGPIPSQPLAATPETLQAATESNPLALWGFILSLLGILCCGFFASVPGIVCGHIALSRIKKNPALQGKGFALAAVIIGYAGLIIWIAYLLAIGIPAVVEAMEEATRAVSE